MIGGNGQKNILRENVIDLLRDMQSILSNRSNGSVQENIMNEQPLVSVIIPTYNRNDCVIKAIGSVLGQTYKHAEIIVIDDGSTDLTYEAVFEFSKKHPNIVLFKNENNLGFVKSLNKGVSLAKGKYIARLDDDDEWSDAKKLEKQIDFLEKNLEYVLVGGGVIKKYKNDQESLRYLLPETDEDIRKVILSYNVFAHSAVVFKRSAFTEAGGYQEQFGFFADKALWLAMGKLGKFYNFSDFFIYYIDQELGSKKSSRDYEIRRKVLMRIRLINQYKNYYPGHKKALLLSLIGYVYSFLPFRSFFWQFLFKLRSIVLGQPPYKYFEP